MVKRKIWDIAINRPFVLLWPMDTGYPWYIPTCNLVHEYPWSEVHLLAGSFSLGFFPTDAEEAACGRPPMTTARLAALGYAAHGQVVTDANPLTHGSLWQGVFCPGMPRWNIWRGQRGQPLVPCFYWDVLAEEGPPGYPWPY